MRRLSGLASACLLGLALAGCEEKVGYVEVRSVPVGARGPTFYLDSAKLEIPKSGVTVLRRAVGTTKLEAETSDGRKLGLCGVTVKKNRITTVTLVVTERPPRCQCLGAAAGPDVAGQRVCVS